MFSVEFVKLCGLTFVFLVNKIVCREITNTGIHRLPELFHLDNYERCLTQPQGVYCLGTFELSAEPSHPLLKLMKEHSKDLFKFNRTQIHRGYCVSQRCPEIKHKDHRTQLRLNSTHTSQKCHPIHSNNTYCKKDEYVHRKIYYERKIHEFERKLYDFEQNERDFEHCVGKFARRYNFSTRLSKLRYCVTHEEYKLKQNRPFDDNQWILIYVILFIMQLNIVGTIYDMTGSKGSSLLLAWSLRVNWARFTRIDDNMLMKRLAPLTFCRMAMQWICIYAHVYLTHFMVFSQNPEEMERYMHGIAGNLIRNGTSLVQVFILLACFLTGLQFLLFVSKSEDAEFNAITIFKWILKRLFRIFPVYALVIVYQGAWWGEAADGPQWWVVRAESATCRRKLWAQLFFVNNIVEPGNFCMLPSWGIAVDMQCYLVSLLTIYVLHKTKLNAKKVLLTLFVLSILLNVALAFIHGWEPVVRLIYPENLRFIFTKTPSFPLIHMSLWSNLPACFLGLFVAYFYVSATQNKQKEKNIIKNNERIRECDVLLENKDIFGRDDDFSNELPSKIQSIRMVHTNELLFERFRKNSIESNVVEDDYEYIEQEINNNGHRIVRYRVKDGKISKVNDRVNLLGKFSTEAKNKLYQEKLTDIVQPQIEISNENRQSEGKFQNDTEKYRRKGVSFHLLSNADVFALPCLVIWVYLGVNIVSFESTAAIAVYVGAERIVFSVLFGLLYASLIKYDGLLRRLVAWSGWQAIGRLAYCLSLIHWCVALSMAAGNTQPIESTLFNASNDWLAIIFHSYLIGLPVCLLVELPAQKFFDILLNKFI